jgi:hypothetical protein
MVVIFYLVLREWDHLQDRYRMWDKIKMNLGEKFLRLALFRWLRVGLVIRFLWTMSLTFGFLNG